MKLDDYLREVDERAGKATGGPWESEIFTDPQYIVGHPGGICASSVGGNDKDNSSFIAHSRQDIPKLILLLRAAMELRENMEIDDFISIPEVLTEFDSAVSEILGESK